MEYFNTLKHLSGKAIRAGKNVFTSHSTSRYEDEALDSDLVDVERYIGTELIMKELANTPMDVVGIIVEFLPVMLNSCIEDEKTEALDLLNKHIELNSYDLLKYTIVVREYGTVISWKKHYYRGFHGGKVFKEKGRICVTCKKINSKCDHHKWGTIRCSFNDFIPGS